MMNLRFSALLMLLAFAATTDAATAQKKQTKTATSKKSAASAQVTTPAKPAEEVISPSEWEWTKKLKCGTKTVWELALGYRKPEYAPRTASDVVEDIREQRIPEATLGRLKKYELPLSRVLLEFGTMKEGLGYYLVKQTELPAELVGYEGKKSLVVTVAVDSVLNTIRLTPKQRAAKVISDEILPKLGDVREALAETDIRFIIVFVAYGTKNFLQRDSLDLKAELVGLVADLNDVAAFAEATISDQQLVDKSPVLFCERETSALDIKRINVTLE